MKNKDIMDKQSLKKKDLAQAGTLIPFLSEHHPGIVSKAWTDLLAKHHTWGKIVLKGAEKLPDPVKETKVVSEILRQKIL